MATVAFWRWRARNAWSVSSVACLTRRSSLATTVSARMSAPAVICHTACSCLLHRLSRYHKENPYKMDANWQQYEVGYWPGDSHSGMFGGNSNWRGPIWLATNFLLIESLQRFHQYYGQEFQIECPTGSGDFMDLGKVAEEIQHRIIHIFGRDENGRRSVNGGNKKLDHDPHFRDYVTFYEYFHADNGSGLGASHQTGWYVGFVQCKPLLLIRVTTGLD